MINGDYPPLRGYPAATAIMRKGILSVVLGVLVRNADAQASCPPPDSPSVPEEQGVRPESMHFEDELITV